MQLRITPARPIGEVQAEFNSLFPFLKLEFFQNKPGSGVDKQPGRIASNKRIGDCQATISDGEIEIAGDMKVSDLESRFKDQFSLNVQVFRRSGSLWLQTTMTDGWSLEKQNEHGMELTLAPKSPVTDTDKNEI